MDGFDVLGTVRDNVALNTIPVIAISSTNDQGSVELALVPGAGTFIANEFGAAELEKRMAEVINER